MGVGVAFAKKGGFLVIGKGGFREPIEVPDSGEGCGVSLCVSVRREREESFSMRKGSSSGEISGVVEDEDVER
ncbi:hypothetical protein COLO4_30140 [Corchorus olitorius]|uniref:Uncharacterized protein n=1 Tax=Corchorus olitorius TaxID=93759 RepID=A0A1R3HAT0_9ROSI|nr:hypothetical protein COLO4_30140 [Corchorus olitorius]